MLKALLYVGLGGAAGSMARYVVYHFRSGQAAWIPTLVVNLVGSFAIGILAGYAFKNSISDNNRLLLMTGLLGGFTTFSAFSLDNLTLLREGKFLLMISYILASAGLGLLACFGGFKLVQSI